MRKTKSRGLFDEHFRLEKISKIKDPLEQLNQFIRWEDLRSIIDKAFPVTDPSVGGRPPFDRIMMFKALVLQRMYNLSDDNTELQILDRLSFCRFLGLGLHDDVPDSKTIWNFREQLKKHDTIHEIFSVFYEKLREASLMVKDGSIVDASIVETPRQRNTREENKQVRQGQIPEDWKDNPHKLCQKDTDAEWTKKNGITYFGYKNHVKIDNGSKLIDQYVITPAATHDSEVLEDLLDETDRGLPLWGDSAYTGKRCQHVIDSAEMESHVNEKGNRHKKLTDKQREKNNEKSRTRARVEHVFGYQWMNLDGATLIRYIGFERCATAIGLRNVIYNFYRSIYLIKAQGIPITL